MVNEILYVVVLEDVVELVLVVVVLKSIVVVVEEVLDVLVVVVVDAKKSIGLKPLYPTPKITPTRITAAKILTRVSTFKHGIQSLYTLWQPILSPEYAKQKRKTVK